MFATLPNNDNFLNSSATALGHNAGDQAETILMHLIRGTGLRGLTGMQLSSERTISGIRMQLLRPLLLTPRTEIEHYCKEANLTPKTDTTNLSMQYSRNGVRANLIPALQNHNPKIESSQWDSRNSVVLELFWTVSLRNVQGGARQ